MSGTAPQRMAGKPVPEPSVTSRPFWEGCAAGELRLPRCRACDGVHFYPRSACPACGGTDLDWVRSAGTGTVYATTVVHRSFWGDAWADDVPYNVAMIELDEGVRMVSAVVGVPADQVHIGMRVGVTFVPRGDTHLPFFERR
ncbi:Zn-ribbon domain-containing OB-fold protein [Pseudonocardia bannensis]|uniref:Zn-ribbon domain-containing OB-fold protein n=1 Tax=Pseudonocardia bannensis TaxID=630973 RepID=A0A848DDV0_9PSEU|nr:Zn-ribbon domain-containing OB-fold protein [Pseudonocardia bannensis]NMH90766.1 Zn-ribbon domain-containing OB-fold protein [Pseudonocardia bannensis]